LEHFETTEPAPDGQKKMAVPVKEEWKELLINKTGRLARLLSKVDENFAVSFSKRLKRNRIGVVL
jgi:hypothetical protein